MRDLAMGIDIGTQATKAVIVEKGGRQIGSAGVEYQVQLPQRLWAEQWPEVWVSAVVSVIRTLLMDKGIDSQRIAGVCISGLYGGSGIPLDDRMNPVRPCIIWMDRRSIEQSERIKRTVDTDRLLRITGNWIDSYFGFTKMLWIRDCEPLKWKKIRLFLPPSSYLVYRLTGETVIDHSSAGNLGGIYNIQRREWSPAAADLLGLPLERLPQRLASSGDIVGEIHPTASRLTGLRSGTPVLAGGVDAAMATLAAGAVASGNSVAMMGTSTCWGMVQTHPRYARDLVSMPHVEDSLTKTYSWAGAATSGGTIRWFRDQLAGGIEPDTATRCPASYASLDRLASQISPGCDGLIAWPYFMGERAPLWDPEARGGFYGLTLRHSGVHLYRALLEASGYSLRHAMDAASASGTSLSDGMIVVGGASRSPLWLQILADITGRPIRTLATDGIGAPVGDAFLVARALGWENDAGNIRAWVKYSEEVRPSEANATVYDDGYRRYRTLHAAMRSVQSNEDEGMEDKIERDCAWPRRQGGHRDE